MIYCINNIWKDGTKCFSGGVDKIGKVIDVSTGQTVQVAAHDEPIKCAKFVDGTGGMQNIVATGSWDKTLKVCIIYFYYMLNFLYIIIGKD